MDYLELGCSSEPHKLAAHMHLKYVNKDKLSILIIMINFNM